MKLCGNAIFDRKLESKLSGQEMFVLTSDTDVLISDCYFFVLTWNVSRFYNRILLFLKHTVKTALSSLNGVDLLCLILKP